jgi:hypothetical protein
MSNGHDIERGEIKATLRYIKENQDKLDKKISEFIESTQHVRLSCTERMTSNERALAYIAERRKDRSALVTAVIALGGAVAAVWASFFK